MKSFYEMQGGTYHEENGYLIPDLVAPESPNIGIWGERKRKYLRTNQKPIYSAMLMNGTLNAYLEEFDQTANKMLDRLIVQMSEREGVTEQLKASNQMAWVQRMNSIRSNAEEIVLSELIHAESGC